MQHLQNKHERCNQFYKTKHDERSNIYKTKLNKHKGYKAYIIALLQ